MYNICQIDSIARSGQNCLLQISSWYVPANVNSFNWENEGNFFLYCTFYSIWKNRTVFHFRMFITKWNIFGPCVLCYNRMGNINLSSDFSFCKIFITAELSVCFFLAEWEQLWIFFLSFFFFQLLGTCKKPPKTLCGTADYICYVLSRAFYSCFNFPHSFQQRIRNRGDLKVAEIKTGKTLIAWIFVWDQNLTFFLTGKMSLINLLINCLLKPLERPEKWPKRMKK